MKNVKKLLLGTAIAGTLVVGAGVGTYSWFTADSASTGTIENGTFGLGEMGQLFQHQKFAPSQLLFSDFQVVQNTGNLDQYLRATFTHNVDRANIKKYKVGYVAMKFKVKPDGTEIPKAQQVRLNALFQGTTNPQVAVAKAAENYEVSQGILSDNQVQSLMKAQAAGDNLSKTFLFGDGNKFWSLKAGEYIAITFGVQLSDTAGNEFQGAKYNAEFKVEAKQTDGGSLYQSEIDTAKQ